MTPQEELRQVAGVSLQVLRAGQGPQLLVLHDYEAAGHWYPYQSALAERFTVLAPSHPGFGTSERPEQIEIMEDVVYVYLDLLEELSGSFNLLGLGLGGWIAAEIAVRCSHNLHRLVLADSVGIKVSGPTEADILDTFIMMDRDELLAATWHDPDLGAQRLTLPGEPDLPYETLVAHIRGRESALRYGWKPFMHNPKLRQWLHRISVPTLVLWGDDDRVVSPAYGRAFQQAIPGSRFQLIDSAGHFPYLEQPEQFVAAVTNFLSEER
ncbi:MAG TPA: alpha/beta hydrolase [Dehalococcoidia bacterium]|nr:alpha/beta hydrolase [Dehalococcoidia bacterium]